jgi:seryl-tRNA synthetase
MLDIKLLRTNLEHIKEQLAKKSYTLDIPFFTTIDKQRKELQIHTEQLQATRNKLAQQISSLAKGSDDFIQAITQSKQVNQQLATANNEFTQVQLELDNFLLGMPNLPDNEVPHGKSEADNAIVRSWGTIPQFAFTAQDHVQLGAQQNRLDFATAANITTSRFVIMHGAIAKLHRALTQFMLDTHTQQHGYSEAYVPQIVASESLIGTGQLPKFADDLFALEGERKLFLIPTAEVPLMNLSRGKLIAATQLPIKYTAHTSSYRSEAGSYGKDTQGMIRQHQFDKVELVQLVQPQESAQAHQELTAQAEKILQLLELPYRVSLLCGGDLGFAATKTYDLEVWLPGQNAYREISSCSNCTDFQTRRLNIKWTNPQTGNKELLHSLNGSGLAVGRTLVAVMENYQQADGSIAIPQVLHPYMQGIKCIAAEQLI